MAYCTNTLIGNTVIYMHLEQIYFVQKLFKWLGKKDKMVTQIRMNYNEEEFSNADFQVHQE